MGAWDATVFGNDDAADFTGEISDAIENRDQVIAALTEAMTGVTESITGLDSWDASVGLAAAALVAAWDHSSLLTEHAYTPETWPPAGGPPEENLRLLARDTFTRVTSIDQNELAQLWIEADLWDEFKADIRRYQTALS